MRIIGLCGRSGSGKGVFSRVASGQGITVIDCDAVYKDLVSHTSECLLELADNFGQAVIKDSALNRQYLAEIVFSSPEKLKLLNSITHKYIRAEIDSIISAGNNSDIFLIDAPTLFESGIDAICDLIIGIISSDEACIERITSRDNITEQKALSRLNNQLSKEFIIENCDIVIYNDSSLSEFESSSFEVINAVREGSI